MLFFYLCNHLHIFDLFLIILTVYCFNEPCINDNTCSSKGFQCRFNHCLCPSNEFWAGHDKHCIPCPTNWINLFVFCIYYEKNERMNWSNADKFCRRMSSYIDKPTRLLEFNNLNEFNFIQKTIHLILTDEQMEIEVINNSNGIILSSAMAFIGSQGRRTSNKTWIYHWANTTDKIYTSTSQMWCKEKYWNTIVISQGEPAWEQDEEIDITFQALKRWSDSDDACLVSLLPNSRQPILCEIIGESDRFRNQSILPFLFTTITTTTAVSSIKTTTTMKDIVINNLAPLTILWSSSTTILATSSTTTVETNLTNVHSEIKQNGSLFIILGLLGILTIISIFIFIIYTHHKKKESSIDLKSNTKQSLSHSKMDQIHVEDLQSNDSSESHFTVETATQESDRIFTDTHSLTPSKTKSIKASKLALWDQMESSLFSSTSNIISK
ncbi:unnamed protein product [Adineta steineri]|uniref:C-type lectin domain-containing protein n=2 Tax=Adineta steineri TaxID=433720 RepID=A0A818ILG7_9BILA|nr:unnamed protein product [Adineta steineri]